MSAGVAGSRDRILLALVAVFVPGRAPSLLSRLGGPGAEPLLSAGIQLAAQPRRERLLALAAALEELRPASATLPTAVAAVERPRTRELLARAPLPGDPPRPAFIRLVLEAREAAEGPPCAPVGPR